MGLKVRGAPWRLTKAEQWYSSRDSGANPTLKNMSELGWSLEAAEPLVWIGRDSGLSDGVLPMNFATGERASGSCTSLVTGPDGYADSALVFGIADSLVTEAADEADNFTFTMWLRSPANGVELWQSSVGGLRVRYVLNPDGTHKIEYYDDNDHFNIPISVSVSDWFMLTIIRGDDTLVAYENSTLINTYGLSLSPDPVSGDITICEGSCAAWGMRMIPRSMTGKAVEYYYNDVVENHANATENIF
jgi:hypothetical protein